MQVIQGIRNLPHVIAKSVVTIGNFDGVHEGHRFLVRRLVEQARFHGAKSVVFTFQPHPIQVLHPEKPLHKLFDFHDQQEQLEKLGVDLLIIEPFSREFSQLDPEQFLTNWVFRPLSPVNLIVGYDFTFGANRRGTIDFLQGACGHLGIPVEVLPPFKIDGQVVSSTRIRQALKDGNVTLAARLLGRLFYVNGLVEKGAGRGRTIGVPTANLRISSESIPAVGVYACYAWVHGQKHKAVANIGFNPTFVAEGEMAKPQLEVHLLDFDGDLYGEDIRTEFVQFLRNEKKFASVEALVTQLREDIAQGRLCLK